MVTRRSEWVDDKELASDQVRSMALNNYNNLLTSGIWSNNTLKDAQILYLVGVAQKLEDDSNKSYDKSNTSNMYSTKGEPAYIMDLPRCILEDPKGAVVNKTKDAK